MCLFAAEIVSFFFFLSIATITLYRKQHMICLFIHSVQCINSIQNYCWTTMQCVFSQNEIFYSIQLNAAGYLLKFCVNTASFAQKSWRRSWQKNRKRKRLFARVNRQSIDECIRVNTFLNKYLYINVRKCTAWM